MATEEQRTEPRKPEEDPAPIEEPTASKRAVLISAMVLVGLLGGVVGLFAAMPEDEGVDVADSSIQAAAADWLGTPLPDAGGEPPSGAEGDPETGSPRGGGDEPIAGGSLPTAEEPANDAPGDADSATARRGVVKSGVPVIKSLAGLGVSAGDAQRIINALEGLFDFRQARPGHEFELRTDPDTGEPVYFRYEASLTDIYVVRKKGDSLVGSKERIRTQKKTRLFGGTIAKSLFAALADLGAHPTLTGKIVDVLSTQVNFYKEQRPGDTFRVMIEEESLDGEFLGYGPVLALEYRGVKSGLKRFFRFEAGKADATYYDEKGVSVPRSAIQIPLHYTRLSSPFGYRFHPVLKRKKLHNGVDFAAAPGTPVWACASGKVTIAGMKGANGNLVGIDHGNGLMSFYAHLSRFGPRIRRGAEVKQRQIIGYVGNTGRSTGPHLHWGLKKNGKFIDPLKYKIRPGRPVPARYRAQLKKIIAQRGAKLDGTRIAAPKGPMANDPDSDSEVLGLEEDF